MHWLLLVGAILFEVAGTTSMKASQGFTRLVPSISLFVCYAISFTLLTFALKKIDMSVSYTLWSGIGTALIALIGWQVFGESMSWLKVGSILLIVAGVVGLTIKA